MTMEKAFKPTGILTKFIKDDDKKGTLGTISQNKNEFEYTPPAVTKETTVTLQFYLEKYPDDVEEWVITIKPKP